MVNAIRPAVVTVIVYDINQAVANIGMIYKKLGNTGLEIESYKSAIRIEPDFAFAHYNLGVALLQSGDKAAALDEYKILKALDQQGASLLFNQIYY